MRTNNKNYFETLREIFTGEHLKSKLLKTTLDAIKYTKSHRTGLSEGSMKVLANYLCWSYVRKVSMPIVDQLISCMIPKEKVSDDVIDMCMKAVVSNEKKTVDLKYSKKILEWILSCLDLDFATTNGIQSYFYFLFPLLQYTELTDLVCLVLYRITTPVHCSDLTVALIKNYLKHQTAPGTALLRYFERLNPQSIEEDIGMDAIHMDDIFNKIPLPPRDEFALVKQLSVLTIQGNSNQSFNEHEPVALKYNRIIPPVKNATSMEGLLSILEFNSVEQIRPYVTDVALPDTFLSLLGSDVGHFVIMTCNEDDQTRFISALSTILHEVFIEMNGDYTKEEKAHFLHQIYILCNTMQQGLNILVPFIKAYLRTWSGLDFCREILHLIEWTIAKTTFSEVFPILKAIRTLYLSTPNLHTKCLIIDTLANMIGSMCKVYYGHKNGVRFPFLISSKPEWTSEPVPMFANTINFVETLILEGLSLNPNCPLLLDNAISFYETVFFFQQECDLPYSTIVPKDIFIDSFYNIDMMLLDRIAGLILLYKTHTYARMFTRQQLLISMDDTELYLRYIKDIVNNVWFCKGFTRREEGVLYTLMTNDFLEKITTNICVEEFDIALAKQPLIYCIKSIEEREELKEYRRKDPFAFLQEHFSENIVKLVTAYLEELQSE